jgi:hypothetical protein
METHLGFLGFEKSQQKHLFILLYFLLAFFLKKPLDG